MGSINGLHIVVAVLLLVSTTCVLAIDYGDALDKSLLFFEAQRSGYLPWNQRVKWRGNSGLRDGFSQQVDLVGGYYDAGDHVKFGLPMAFSVTLLSWAAVDFSTQIYQANQMERTLEAIQWGTDYFVKAHPENNVLWAQVGEGESDHCCWERSEDMSTPRTAYKLDSGHPGSDVAAETAAALAAASLAFKPYNSSYSALLLTHAKQIFSFADNYRGEYDDSIPDAKSFYPSSGYSDELLWAAAWLHRATGNEYYLQYAVNNGAEMGGTGNAVRLFSWDNKYAGLQVLLSKVLFEGNGYSSGSILEQYKAKADFYACAYLQKNDGYNVPMTPGGLAYILPSNNLQYAASAAFLLAIYSDYLTASNMEVSCPAGPLKPHQLLSFAVSQGDYILGKNPQSMSYMVGFGDKYPKFVHHRGGSIPSMLALPSPVGCAQGFDKWFKSPAPDPNVVYGALVGGPDSSDDFTDSRSNYEQSEPTTTAAAPLIGLFSRLLSVHSSSPTSATPTQTSTPPSVPSPIPEHKSTPTPVAPGSPLKSPPTENPIAKPPTPGTGYNQTLAPSPTPSPIEICRPAPVFMVRTRSSSPSAMDINAQLEEVRNQSEARATELKSELQSQIAELRTLMIDAMGSKQISPSSEAPSLANTANLQDESPLTPDNVTLNPKPPDIQTSAVPQLAATSKKSPFIPGGLATRLSKIEFPKFDGTMLRRFGRLFDDPLADLVSIKQGSDSVEDYLDKFECALTRLQLPMNHALSIFLTNLHPHLALHARQFSPATMSDAARIARLHESAIQQTPPKPHHRPPFNPSTKTPWTPNKTPPPAILPTPNPSKPLALQPQAKTFERQGRRYSYDEMQERRRNGMCMFCEEPFSPGHHLKHKKSQVYVMECEDDYSSSGDEQISEPLPATTKDDPSSDHSKISVNALDGSATFNCMRVVGQVNKTRIHILTDPESSHNFLDLAIAKALGCPLELAKPLSVSAANGNEMISSYKCADFSWKLQGYFAAGLLRPCARHSMALYLRPYSVGFCASVNGLQPSRHETHITGSYKILL
ncbi:hypothetical protein V2J09_011535 [Rumex salicifolius]